jgi:hypothetical protein
MVTIVPVQRPTLGEAKTGESAGSCRGRGLESYLDSNLSGELLSCEAAKGR